MRKIQNGKVFLTSAEKSMPLDVLHKHLQELGFKISRPGCWYAKNQGWFVERQAGRWGRASTYGYVALSPLEKRLHATTLAEILGLTVQTAERAQARGWFEITANNKDLVKIDPDRIQQGDLPFDGVDE